MSNPLGERPGVTRGQLTSGAIPIPASAINGSNTFVGVLDQFYAEGVTPIFAASTSRLLGWPFNDGDAMARIRETGADALEDFSYVGLPPRLDFAGIDSFASGNTGRWRTWQNQCGTLLCADAVQATDASQPLYVQNIGPDFDGSAHFMSIAHSANQLMTGGLTLAMSIRPDAFDGTGMPIAKADDGSVTGGFRLLTTSTAATLNIRVGVTDVSSSAVFTAAAWHHLIITIASDGSTAFYRNNVAAGTGTAGALSNLTSTNPIRIGARYDGTAGFFNGALDDLFIIPEVVSSDVRALVYAGRSI